MGVLVCMEEVQCIAGIIVLKSMIGLHYLRRTACTLSYVRPTLEIHTRASRINCCCLWNPIYATCGHHHGSGTAILNLA